MGTATYPNSLFDTAIRGNPSPVPSRNKTADVISRARDGDLDAFSELYSQHKRRVFSVCMRIVCDTALAEDLTQDTFLQVFRKIGAFRGDSVFTTWLHRVAVNTVLMHLRKRALTVVSLDHLMSSGDEQHAGRSFGTRDLAQAGIVDRMAIERAVSALAPGYRSVFLLHDVEGFEYGEIAAMLKCSCGNTKSQLHKARRALRGALVVRRNRNGDTPASSKKYLLTGGRMQSQNSTQ